MFIVFVRDADECEVIVNTDLISKIEVHYGIKEDGQNIYTLTSLDKGRSRPEARRFYTIFVAGEEFKVIPDNSRAWSIIEKIWRDAVRD
jgi:hypothetical protein